MNIAWPRPPASPVVTGDAVVSPEVPQADHLPEYVTKVGPGARIINGTPLR